jgi:esterase
MSALLHHRRVVAPGSAPGSWLLVLHGIFGRGRNWSTIASGLVAARPDFGVELVDLRLHGSSQDFSPPHDLASSARDVRALIDADPARKVVALLGHSFGGKVALQLSLDPPASLRQTWIVDASPSVDAPEGDTWKVIRIVRSLPQRFATRDEAVRGLQGGGIDESTARWMPTNLVAADGGYRWAFDLEGIESLLRDYFARDLWAAVEAHRVPEIHYVKALQSLALSPADDARLDRAAAADPAVHFVRRKGGHWLHAEDPAGVISLLRDHLPAD